ncbi:MAG: acetylglutamate kinase [Zetaproteobacteria bacterium]|nr:MAG: acetylglutamate kinase [Zetaproteobacteria bacterium]
MKKKLPDFFINAFYESKFRDNLFIVKASGSVIEDDTARNNLIANIRELTHHGIKVILIYGGGNAIDAALKKRGVEIKKNNGRRITDAATMDVIREVIGGDLSLKISESMHSNNLDGLSFNVVPSGWMNVSLRPKEPVDYGFVGNINGVNTRPILRQLKVTGFIACACLAISEQGDLCNINADTIATELAAGLDADKLIFMSDVDGVRVKGETALLITDTQIQGYIADGTVTDGMKVKMENCQAALDAGVSRIHLINGLRDNALSKEIFESVGPGTMLLRDAERDNYMNEVEVQKAIGGK